MLLPSSDTLFNHISMLRTTRKKSYCQDVEGGHWGLDLDLQEKNVTMIMTRYILCPVAGVKDDKEEEVSCTHYKGLLL